MEQSEQITNYIVENKTAYHYNDDQIKYYIKLLNHNKEIQVCLDIWNKQKIGKPYEQ